MKMEPMELVIYGRKIGCVIEPVAGPLHIGGEVRFNVRMRRRWWAPFAIAWALAVGGPMRWWVRPYAFVTTLARSAAVFREQKL